jgi:hypothetical protein
MKEKKKERIQQLRFTGQVTTSIYMFVCLMMMIDECRSHTYMTEQRKKIFDVDVID